MVFSTYGKLAASGIGVPFSKVIATVTLRSIRFESFPIVFIEIYGFTLGQQGLAFLGLLVGALITLVCLFSWLYFYQEKQFNENGEIEPEKRLQPAMVGAFFVPICLFWFGWSARSDIHWIMPIIGSSFFSVAAFLLFQAVLPYLSDAYPEYLASVFAGNDLFRSSFGAGFRCSRRRCTGIWV